MKQKMIPVPGHYIIDQKEPTYAQIIEAFRHCLDEFFSKRECGDPVNGCPNLVFMNNETASKITAAEPHFGRHLQVFSKHGLRRLSLCLRQSLPTGEIVFTYDG